MKAICHHAYGGPEILKPEEIPEPSPGRGEVLVKVHASSLNRAEWHLMAGTPFPIRLMFGLRRPRNPRLGADVAGRVEALGPGATAFGVGDEVFGDLSVCGFGAWSEWVSVPESALVLKPVNLSPEEAACVPVSAVTALQGLRDHGRTKRDERVLINGASGNVGLFAVQIAKALGAEVTGVCRTENFEMVRSVGADRIIDHTHEDFTQTGERWDLVLDLAARRSVFHCRRALTPTGVYVLVGGDFSRFLQISLLGPMLSGRNGQRLGNMITKPNREDLETVKGMIEHGEVRPLIGRRFPLSEASEAMRFHESGRAQGKIVITA